MAEASGFRSVFMSLVSFGRSSLFRLSPSLWQWECAGAQLCGLYQLQTAAVTSTADSRRLFFHSSGDQKSRNQGAGRVLPLEGSVPVPSFSWWPAVFGGPCPVTASLRRHVAAFSVCVSVASYVLIKTPVIGHGTHRKSRMAFFRSLMS